MSQHFHKDEETGTFVRCMKSCTDLLSDVRFWIGITISYPLEHYLWEHIWPFTVIMNFLGL